MNLPELPDGWAYLPLKRLADVRSSSVDKHTLPDEETVGLCNYLDVYRNDRITATLNFMEASATPKERSRFALKAGDVLLTKDSEDPMDIGVPAYVAEDLPDVLCGYHLALLRPRDGVDGSYLQKALLSTTVREQFYSRAQGVTRFGLGLNEIGGSRVPLPPPAQQRSIARFLDRRTAAVDVLIAKKERQIELLREKRQALITQAVTRGLDETVPTKDSGIAWLDELPVHWKVVRGRYVFREIALAPEPIDGVVTAFRDGEVTLRENRRSEGFMVAEKEAGYQHVRRGDLVVHSMDAFAGAIGVSDSDGKCTPEYVVLEPKFGGIMNEYYALLLRVMAKRSYILVICPSVRERAPRFRFATFKDIWLPVPPPEEQARIVTFCGRVTSAAEELIGRNVMLVSRLREYRQALICAAVTGKIDIATDGAV